MKITSTLVKCHTLKPGDLFSTCSQAIWDEFVMNDALGLKIYVRTDTPCPDDQANEDIYKITIKRMK